MQWLIDLIKEWVIAQGYATEAWVLGKNYITLADVELYLKGMIVMWSGTTGDIPDGWALCTGSQGTPDLTGRFIHAPGPGKPVHQAGGVSSHLHIFTGDGHEHRVLPDSSIQVGDGYFTRTSIDPATGTTLPASHIPRYYVLAFIMKL